MLGQGLGLLWALPNRWHFKKQQLRLFWLAAITLVYKHILKFVATMLNDLHIFPFTQSLSSVEPDVVWSCLLPELGSLLVLIWHKINNCIFEKKKLKSYLKTTALSSVSFPSEFISIFNISIYLKLKRTLCKECLKSKDTKFEGYI